MRIPPAVLAATVALAAVAAVAARPATGATVTLRVESASDPTPLFSGPVDTAPHTVDGGDGSGAHPCWGPPSGAPVPTATGALDDGLRSAGISWQGSWNQSFRDFFIERIGPHASAPPDDYWSLSVNGRFSSGGCLAQVADGDEVRFFFGPLFGESPDLSPAGAGGAAQGESPSRGQSNGGPARKVGDPRRLARRATRFLLRHDGGAGGEWAELALALRGHRRPSPAAQRLAERLLDRSSDAPRSDVDSTALDAWALTLAGRDAAARRTAAAVRAAQSADGGFPLIPGGASNAQSTGVALIALRVTGLGPRPSVGPGGPTPLDYLASLGRRDGSIAYARGSTLTPTWTTAQALLGLTNRACLLSLDLAAAVG